MIWYFREGFMLSVRVKIEQRGRELDSLNKLVKKAVNAKDKTTLWPCFYACKTDQHYFRGSWLSTAKASTQG